MTRFRLLQPLLPLAIALLLGLQLMEPSRAWVILLVTFSGVFLSAFLWAWVLGRNLHLRRETRLGWIQVGGRVEERLTISNTSSLPAPSIELIDRSTLPGFDASRSTGIGADYFDQWTAGATCHRRGLFSLGGAQIRSGDPFGVFELTLHASQRTSILVLPQIADLPEFILSTSGTAGDSRPRRNAPQQTIHASSVREYQHGDGMRQIHWPTTARMNKVFVRLMEGAPEGDWWIVLDLDASAMLGAGWDSIEEQGVTLAASLADAGLRAGKSVGLVSSGEQLAWLPPQKGEGQRWEILQALAVARPGRLPLSSLFEKMGASLGKHHSLLVITACTRLDWLKSLLPLAKRGVIPTVLMLDPATFGGETSAEYSASILEGRGVRCHVIPRGLIEGPKAKPAASSSWTWRAAPTGEVIPIKG